jgi:Holliday junction resolvase RusA-like endonuclease
MTITVYGHPAPQGSKRFLGFKGGKGIMVESSKAVKPWREAVKYQALMHLTGGGTRVPDMAIAGPVRVQMYFTLPKPKSAPKNRVTYPDRKPDLSKLVRATEDALTDAGVWEDDARVIQLHAEKRYPVTARGMACEPDCTCASCEVGAMDRPGAVIVIESA